MLVCAVSHDMWALAALQVNIIATLPQDTSLPYKIGRLNIKCTGTRTGTAIQNYIPPVERRRPTGSGFLSPFSMGDSYNGPRNRYGPILEGHPSAYDREAQNLSPRK